MSKGLSKVRGIQFDIPPDQATAPVTSPAAASAPARAPYTGIMRHSASVVQAQQAQARIEQLEQERGAQKLDPSVIRPSRWANRHDTAFQAAAFESLKSEIADAGGNVQPIKIRPLVEAGNDGVRYEVVFGHRRHRACLELGLPVLAVVQEMDDRELWTEMERENRNREGLSAWEQGMMYRRALDAGLFPSLRMLAQAIGRDPTAVSKAIRIASLPDDVVAAFPSPNEIQFRWAAVLADTCRDHPEPVSRKANEIAGTGLTAADVFAALIAAAKPGVEPFYTEPVEPFHTLQLDLGRGATAQLKTKGKRLVLEMDAELLPLERRAELAPLLRKLLKR